MPKETVSLEIDDAPLAEFIRAAMAARETAGRQPVILLYDKYVRVKCATGVGPNVHRITLFPSDDLLKMFADESAQAREPVVSHAVGPT